MNIRTYAGIVTGLLLISVAFHIWTYRETSENSSRHALDREVLIKGAKANQEKAQAKFDSIANKLVNDSTAQAKRDSASTVKETRLTGEIRHWKRLRNEAGVKIDTFTVVIEAKSDSLRAADSLQIVALKQDKLTLKEDYKGQIEAMTTKYLEQIVISDAHESTAKELKTDLKKEKKRKTGWKIAAIALAGWLVYDEIKD